MKKIGISLSILVILGVLFWVSPFEFQKTRKDLTAEQVLEQYLNTVFSVKDLADRQNLLMFTTGSLKEALSKAEDSVFEEAYLRHKYKLLRYSLISRRDQTPMEAHLTYQLVYQDEENREGQPDQHEYTIENTVSMVRQDEKWFIQEVLGNKKTNLDFPIPEVITPGGSFSSSEGSAQDSAASQEENEKQTSSEEKK